MWNLILILPSYHIKRKPYDRYAVRSSDCHATDAHKGATNVRKLYKRTSGGASNLFAHEDLEHL